jgi:methylenetetrahydrofolate reductase (NADPH)
MAPTIDLCIELSHRGFDVIPHLAAQLTRDRSELVECLERLTDAGIERALVVGGVADQPGEFLDAMALLVAIDESGVPLREMGIGGYPEGHQEIPEDPIERSLLEKAPRSAWITTQICMDAAQTDRWIERQRRRGIDLPIWLGITGVADVTGLMSLGLRIGAGRSLQFMFEHPRLVTRLLRPGGRAASELVVKLAELAADDRTGIAGFHLFTYNQVRSAERWRSRLLTQLE